MNEWIEILIEALSLYWEDIRLILSIIGIFTVIYFIAYGCILAWRNDDDSEKD